MSAVNIELIILGIAIPIGMAIFWSKLAKMLHTQNKSHNMILGENNYKIIEWTYHHRSKFNIFMIFLVSIIEFLALVPF